MADIKEALKDFSPIEILGEVLRRDRMERAHSPLSMHLVTALSTFGQAGQAEVRKADAARASRTLPKTSSETYRQWNPAQAPGKPSGLPVSETVEASMVQSKPQAKANSRKSEESQPSEKRSVAVAEISVSGKTETSVEMSEFQDLLNAKPADIPTRPTKVLELYGIEQIKTFLEISGVEINEDLNEREIAALLIKTVKKA